MSLISDAFRSSFRSVTTDSEKGSLRKLVELLARDCRPNSIVSHSRQTHATGTTYVAFATKVGYRIFGVNGAGTSLTFRLVASPATTVVIASAAAIDLPCAANASEWELKRTDDSNTQVTLNIHVYNTV